MRAKNRGFLIPFYKKYRKCLAPLHFFNVGLKAGLKPKATFKVEGGFFIFFKINIFQIKLTHGQLFLLLFEVFVDPFCGH